jgi:hypothetical protein
MLPLGKIGIEISCSIHKRTRNELPIFMVNSVPRVHQVNGYLSC